MSEEIASLPAELQRTLVEFQSAAEEIVNPFLTGLGAGRPPEIVYHYTDDVGLRGILESGNLWLSDIFNLNDPSELSHGFSHVTKILLARAKGSSRECQEFAAKFSHFSRAGISSSADYFVCAFSRAGDDLGQWRAYADNGRGYAIGFDASKLENAFIQQSKNTTWNNSTFPVTYDEAILVDMHTRMVDKMFSLISLPGQMGLPQPQINLYLKNLSVYLSSHAMGTALHFKHPAYSNEQEYRFLKLHGMGSPLTNVKRRFRAYELVRYQEFNWSGVRDALKRIVVGPSADHMRALKYADNCLKEFHGTLVPIDRSVIPYRAL